MLMTINASPTTIYRMAIIGTSFSVTDAMRLTPPMNINPATTARTPPIIFVSIPNAPLKASLIELACTILPIKPSANIIETAKKPARNFAKGLFPNPREM